MCHWVWRSAPLAIASALCCATSSAAPVIRYADDDNCPGPGAGSPADPFCRVQDAIAAANDGDVILVEQGTYLENLNFLGKAVTVQGQGAPGAVILQGASTARVVRFTSGEGPDAVLDGFVITGGGGGITCRDSEPTIRNCRLTGNTADAGAGIDCYNARPTITRCTIVGNTANEVGGGVYCTTGSAPTIRQCTISGNSAALSGGGVFCKENSNAVLNGCTIADNDAQHGGGLYLFDNSRAILRRCAILDNTAVSSGGGVVCGTSDADFDECIFRGNRAEAGAGVSAGGASPRIANSIFENNVATQIGGGLLCNDSRASLVNCLFTGNQAGYGGGAVYNYNFGQPTLVNCTLYDNQAFTGGGVYNGANSQPTLRNCIVWRATSGAIVLDDTSGAAVSHSIVQGGWPGVGNSDVFSSFAKGGTFHLRAGSNGIDIGDNEAVPALVTGDFDGGPRFVDDPETPDGGSGAAPIVDMGAFEFRDCDGNGVEDDTDIADCTGGAKCVDRNGNGLLDACEVLGDLNGDRRVGAADIARFVSCLAGVNEDLPPIGCRSFDFATADLDTDGDVDLQDAAGLLNAFEQP